MEHINSWKIVYTTSDKTMTYNLYYGDKIKNNHKIIGEINEFTYRSR